MISVHRGAVVVALSTALLLAACGGDGPDSSCGEAGPPPGSLPAVRGSRLAAIEFDDEADGSVDRITLFSYDAVGRLALVATHATVGGVASGAPVAQTRWTYDACSRIAAIRRSPGAGGSEAAETMVYGADGRLALSRVVGSPGAPAVETRYTWLDGRLIEARIGNGDTRTLISYGDDGFVSGQRTVFATGDWTSRHYAWRPDGRLQSLSWQGDFVASYRLVYESDGRHVATLGLEGDLEISQAQISRDATQRLIEITWDNRRDTIEFVPHLRARWRWESAPCQPVVWPGAPPYEAYVEEGGVSPNLVSFHCGR